MHNAAIQHPFSTVSSDSNPTIGVADRCVARQYIQLNSILPPTSFFHHTIGSEEVCGSAPRVDQAMDVLRTGHSVINGVKWYVQTLNNALPTQCAVLWFVM
ncbi:hypothetical protein TNCV_4905651 [Trichonephila clavipes]|uniref:Uncharacterized protein n=1 Tax=Trichonephila clavipes TaxID=2585209 RepID=A0A8X6RS84_TRICX|nr:hypothetical protein TNCV_4905651 [Trichonephila clavipes]